ncbi:hypothetical protein RJ640_030216 [Escallonia rubra]|uniref:Uncharacterized protein n=1 Tax=Escallonia rubra TaxID=112253 RepID=A0AA88RRF1_9ASTE|nr:hypothetical protein RJ640_030216 [Escallonia rubra]
MKEALRASSGIGVETARVLAKRGVRVVVPARDLKKGSQLKEMIQKESPEAKIILLEIDLGSFASIKSFCSEFLSLNLPLNSLMAFSANRTFAGEDGRDSSTTRHPRKNSECFFCRSQMG